MNADDESNVTSNDSQNISKQRSPVSSAEDSANLYVILHGVDRQLRTYNPALINRCLHTLVDGFGEICVLKSGDIKLQCVNTKQRETLLQCTAFAESNTTIPIVVSHFKSNNYVRKGVIKNQLIYQMRNCKLLLVNSISSILSDLFLKKMAKLFPLVQSY